MRWWSFGWVLLMPCLAATAQTQSTSLYRADSYQALVSDHRARKVGDSVVVLVYESATATNQANTKVNKNSSVNLSAGDTHNTVGAKLNTANDADGGGVEKRSGEVVARVSATITAQLASGEYFVEGQQHISLNNESQTITVAGRVRPEDIDTNNTVISTRIADAQIEFKGHGLLSSRESPGIITRLFNWLF